MLIIISYIRVCLIIANCIVILTHLNSFLHAYIISIRHAIKPLENKQLPLPTENDRTPLLTSVQINGARNAEQPPYGNDVVLYMYVAIYVCVC